MNFEKIRQTKQTKKKKKEREVLSMLESVFTFQGKSYIKCTDLHEGHRSEKYTMTEL